MVTYTTIQYAGNRFTTITFHEDTDVRQNQLDISDQTFDKILKQVFGINLNKSLEVGEILKKNKKGIEAFFPTKKDDGKPKTDEKLKKVAKPTREEKEKIKRQQDERAKRGEKEKKIEETETAM